MVANLYFFQVIDFGSSCYEHQRVYTYIQSRSLYFILYTLYLHTEQVNLSLQVVQELSKYNQNLVKILTLKTVIKYRSNNKTECLITCNDALLKIDPLLNILKDMFFWIRDLSQKCGESTKNDKQFRFYRAPEVILGAKYGMPIDMWSLGGNTCFNSYLIPHWYKRTFHQSQL